MILCWSAKGGSGTTVVACSLALSIAHRTESSWFPARRQQTRRLLHDAARPPIDWPHLIDLAGDVPLVLGSPLGDGPGVFDWMASAIVATDSLWSLSQSAGPGLRFIPRGQAPDSPDWSRLADAVAGSPVIIDCGTGRPPEALLAVARHSLLVTRACYLSLARSMSLADAATGIVLVREPGRVLGLDDIERCLGRPVVSTIDVDPKIARAVDAGLAISRLPRTLTHLLPDALERAG